VRSQIEKLSKNLKPQNPVSVAEKVSNPVDMETALRGYQRFDLGKTANFEPARPANIPGYIANNSARLLFMPVPGGPNEDVISWLTPSDPDSATLQSHFNRKTLRDWKNATRNTGAFVSSVTRLRGPIAYFGTLFWIRKTTNL